MDDAFFRDLINHALKLGADDAFVDEDRTIRDVDHITGGSVSQMRRIDHKTTLYIKAHQTFMPLQLNLDEHLQTSLATLQQRISEALKLAQLADAWSTDECLHTMPPLIEDDTYRFVDPFDDDPDAPLKRRRELERFLNARTTERAPILLRDYAAVGSLGVAFDFKATQTIARRTQRRITATQTTTASSGSTRLERAIAHQHLDQTTELHLPDYTQIGYGIDPNTSDATPIMDMKTIAQFYGESRGAAQNYINPGPAMILGAWSTCVILHETIHQSPYYLAQTEQIAIDSNRGILQCSTPTSSCSAYAIHPTTEHELALTDILAQCEDGTLYLDAPTFLVRHPDTSIDITFSIARSVRHASWSGVFRPVTIKFVPHNFWKWVKLGFGPLCRISLHCQNGEPTFQAPGLWLGAAPGIV